MRAYIDELNANLDERRIAVDHLQSKAKILYFTSSFERQDMRKQADVGFR
jgi:uncharacterized coiled-coil protein SlyX